MNLAVQGGELHIPVPSSYLACKTAWTGRGYHPFWDTQPTLSLLHVVNWRFGWYGYSVATMACSDHSIRKTEFCTFQIGRSLDTEECRVEWQGAKWKLYETNFVGGAQENQRLPISLRTPQKELSLASLLTKSRCSAFDMSQFMVGEVLLQGLFGMNEAKVHPSAVHCVLHGQNMREKIALVDHWST